MIDEWKMKASKLKSLTQWLNLENCHPRVLKAKKNDGKETPSFE